MDLKTNVDFINVPVKVTKIYRKQQRAKAQTVVSIGGAGSSKSFSLAQYLIFDRCLKYKNLEILVLRKVRHSLKLTFYRDFIKLLKYYDLYNEEEHNKSDMTYTFTDTGSYIQFCGLEDRETIKSTQWHEIILEEANQFVPEDYTFLKVRLYRGEKTTDFIPRIRMNLNPVECWIKKLEGKRNVEFIWSNYKDNPYTNEEYRKTLEALKDEDPIYYAIYTIGTWAKPKGIIYKSYAVDKIFPDHYDYVIFGLDFGFNHPSALLQIGVKDKIRYLTQLLYQTGLTNPDLIVKLNDIIPEKHKREYIYADCAEPARIKDINTAGFICYGADKSVKDGLDFCRSQKYHTLETNVHLNEERAGYKYKEDRQGNVLDEPVKFRDHLMDCKRYADYTHHKEEKVDIKKTSEDVEKESQRLPDTLSSEQDS